MRLVKIALLTIILAEEVKKASDLNKTKDKFIKMKIYKNRFISLSYKGVVICYPFIILNKITFDMNYKSNWCFRLKIKINNNYYITP